MVNGFEAKTGLDLETLLLRKQWQRSMKNLMTDIELVHQRLWFGTAF